MTGDVPGLAAFYEEVLGFERVPAPTYSGFQVAWLRLSGSPDVALHPIKYRTYDTSEFCTRSAR